MPSARALVNGRAGEPVDAIRPSWPVRRRSARSPGRDRRGSSRRRDDGGCSMLAAGRRPGWPTARAPRRAVPAGLRRPPTPSAAAGADLGRREIGEVQPGDHEDRRQPQQPTTSAAASTHCTRPTTRHQRGRRGRKFGGGDRPVERVVEVARRRAFATVRSRSRHSAGSPADASSTTCLTAVDAVAVAIDEARGRFVRAAGVTGRLVVGCGLASPVERSRPRRRKGSGLTRETHRVGGHPAACTPRRRWACATASATPSTPAAPASASPSCAAARSGVGCGSRSPSARRGRRRSSRCRRRCDPRTRGGRSPGRRSRGAAPRRRRR
jgi:hypothetical protein